MPLDSDDKELLFEFMDISKLKMIDYKTFLSFMNGKGSAINESEKYDWVEQCFERIKQWYASSGFPIQKAFKLVDRDGDSYIS